MRTVRLWCRKRDKNSSNSPMGMRMFGESVREKEREKDRGKCIGEGVKERKKETSSRRVSHPREWSRWDGECTANWRLSNHVSHNVPVDFDWLRLPLAQFYICVYNMRVNWVYLLLLKTQDLVHVCVCVVFVADFPIAVAILIEQSFHSPL